jgi:predicted branched-subunit amino acid permease
MPGRTRPSAFFGAFERSELIDGAVQCIWPALAVFFFAVAMGAVAQSKSWSLAYAALFCLGIMGASAQVAALQLWDPSREAVQLLLAGIALHSRYILICASIAPLIRQLNIGQRLLVLHFTTDSNWAVSMARIRRKEPATSAFLLGGGLLVAACYLSGSMIGVLLGDHIPNLRAFGLDFAIPGVFLCLLIGLWKSPQHDLIPWSGAAVAAIAAKVSIPGGWYVLIGGGVGAAVAMVVGLRANGTS